MATETALTSPARYNELDFQDETGSSLYDWGTLLLRWRRRILLLGFIGGFLGGLSGLLSSRVYRTDVTFLPQGSSQGMSGIALAASQFGFNIGSSGGADWWPAIYVAVLNSRALLEPIAQDSLVVGGRRRAIADIFEIEGESEAMKIANTVVALRSIISSGEDKRVGSVNITVMTEWPEVSLGLAKMAVEGVNQFNLQARKSLASAEWEFVDRQTRDAGLELRASENRLQNFLQQNRVVASPELAFQQERLQREVALRQGIYTTLMNSREEARLREVRNTPAITMLEDPRMPVIGEARGTVLRALVGAIAGTLLGIFLAFAARALVKARQEPNPEAREFLSVLEESLPKFARKWFA